MRSPKTYFVYIMTNRSKTLYTDVTNSLLRRVREHKLGIGSGFTTIYELDRLVYFERFEDVHRAIGREKQIKGWLRIKKIALIVSVNPAWRDLSLEWYERHPFQPDAAASQGIATTAPSSCNPERLPYPTVCHPEQRVTPHGLSS
ncbi:MAG TPA: GIY-YIG nuclease family protein [Candidatus Sulfotelmatobacter sp.]|nr:GIY-YIG nuclease family protein [Candidatus Sulfotelmatobacter sp.]